MQHQKPAFDQVNIIVGDFARSLDFYHRLGVAFPESATAKTDTQFHVNGETSAGFHFELDNARFARVWNRGWTARPDLVGRIVLGFGVASREAVDQLYAELTGAGYPALAPPHDAFWGARYAILEDPNCIAVGVMSPIDPARKTWPPEGWSE
jgi:catechol 2,3-dioxygenase-like lactoylglutathione lyase family enzyme